MCIAILPAFMPVNHWHAWWFGKMRKRVLNSLGLGLQMVVNLRADAGN